MFSATLTELVNGQSDMFVRQHRYFTENLSKNLPNKSSAYSSEPAGHPGLFIVACLAACYWDGMGSTIAATKEQNWAQDVKPVTISVLSSLHVCLKFETNKLKKIRILETFPKSLLFQFVERAVVLSTR